MTKTQQQMFLDNIMQLCFKYNGSITSWIRTERRNKQVNGATHSQHLTGTAVDIVLDNKENIQPLIIAAEKLGLTAFNEVDHIHIQIKE